MAKKSKKNDALASAGAGEYFLVTIDVDILEYGVEVITVSMQKNAQTSLSECRFPGCVNSMWCKGPSSNAMHFAKKHVNAHHLPDKINRKPGSSKIAKATLLNSFFSPLPRAPPQRADKYAMSAHTIDLTCSPGFDLVDGGSFEILEPLLCRVSTVACCLEPGAGGTGGGAGSGTSGGGGAGIVQLAWPRIVPCRDSLGDVLQRLLTLDANTAPLARAREDLRAAGAAADDAAATGLAGLAALSALALALPNLAVLATRNTDAAAAGGAPAPPLPFGADAVVADALARAMRVTVTVDQTDDSADAAGATCSLELDVFFPSGAASIVAVGTKARTEATAIFALRAAGRADTPALRALVNAVVLDLPSALVRARVPPVPVARTEDTALELSDGDTAECAAYIPTADALVVVRRAAPVDDVAECPGMVTQTEFARCPGVALTVPSPGNENYPFGVHSILRLPYSVSLSRANEVVLHAHLCTKDVLVLTDGVAAACDFCVDTANGILVKNIVARSHDDDLHYSPCRLVYLTQTQQQNRFSFHRQRDGVLRIRVFKQRAKIERQCKVIDDFKRIQLMLSENDMPRVRRFMAVMIKRGASAKVILRELSKAIDGKYHPRFSDREKKIADIVLIIGGPKLLYVLQKECQLVSASTVRRMTDRPVFHVSSGMPTKEELLENGSSSFMNVSESNGCTRALQTVMIDGVNAEGRVRPRTLDSVALGFSRQSDFSQVLTAHALVS